MLVETMSNNTALRFLVALALEKRLRVVAVSGGTCSGKSTFSNVLSLWLQTAGITSSVLPLDWYYKDFEDPSFPKKKGKLILDVPESFLSEKFFSDVVSLVSWESVYPPARNVVRNMRKDEQLPNNEIHPAEVIIAEGLFASTFLQEKHFPVLSVFVDTPMMTCLMRRIERDTKVYGVSASQVGEAWRSKILPFWEQYIMVQRNTADLVIAKKGG